jgi:uncharacterized phiE125 gp8 family phage protein
LAEVKRQVRVVTNDDNHYLQQLVKRATAWCENYTRRAFVTQTWELKLDEWWDERYASVSRYGSWRRTRWTENAIFIPRAPLIAVSSITYLDLDGNTDTIATTVYRVDTSSEPGRITLDYNQTWPSDLRLVSHPITITHTAGYGAQSAVPDDIKHAILMLVGHWYENRESTHVGTISKEVEFSVKDILSPHQMGAFA